MLSQRGLWGGNGVPLWGGILGRNFPFKRRKARCLRLMQAARLLRKTLLKVEAEA